MYRKSPITVMIFLAVWVLFSAISACRPPAGQPSGPPPESPATAAPPADEQPGEKGYIDTHMHLDGLYMSKGTLVKDYETAADNLVALMDRYGVAKSVIVIVPTHFGQSGQADYEDVRSGVRKYPDRLQLMAGGSILTPIFQETDPAAVTPELRAEFEEKAEKLIEEEAIGFGEMLSLHLCLAKKHAYFVALPDHPLFLLLADIAARHNVPIDLHMEAMPQDMPLPANLAKACSLNPSVIPASIPAFERLLDHNKDARIVWQHIGWDNTGYMTVELLRELLEAHPNLYLSMRVEEREFMVGEGGPMPNRIVDKKWQIRPEWLDLISDFPDRFMIGGDEFVGIPGQTPNKPQSFEETWAILDQFPPDLARQVGYENAARVYNLE